MSSYSVRERAVLEVHWAHNRLQVLQRGGGRALRPVIGSLHRTEAFVKGADVIYGSIESTELS